MSINTVLVSGQLYNPDGSPAAYADIRFTLSGLGVAGLSLLVPRFSATKCDASGAFVLQVVPNPPGTRYDVRAGWAGALLFSVRAVVPNNACQLTQIMDALPYPAIDASQQALLDLQAAQAEIEADRLSAADNAAAADASKTLAQDWATKTTGEVVAGQGYSAKQYAHDAIVSASVAAGQAELSESQASIAIAKAVEASDSADDALAIQVDLQTNWGDKLVLASAKAAESAASAAASETSRQASVSAASSVVNIVQPAVDSAVESAATATTQAGLASTAKIAAEAARDAANVNGKIYATTAAGLAAVASGAYFSVPSPDSAEYLILYLNNAGVAVEQKRYASAALALDNSYRASIVVQTREDFAPVSAQPRVVVIRDDASRGHKTTLNFWDGQALRFGSDVAFNSATVFTTEAGGIYNISARETLFQDHFMQTPVTASGQPVAVVRDIRGRNLGAELVTIAGFGAASGWAKTAYSLVATNATSDLQHLGVAGVVGFCYWIEFDLTITAGNVSARVGLNNGPDMTTSGRKGVYIRHTSNTTAGIYFHGVGFTGVIKNVTVKVDGADHLVSDQIAALPVYRIDANGIPYLDTTAAQLQSAYARSASVPIYMAMAVARTVNESKAMVLLYGDVGNGLSVGNQPSWEVTPSSQAGGSSAHIYTPGGAFGVNVPAVMDVLVKPGITSSWFNGGEQDILPGTNGTSRESANLTPEGAVVANAKLYINYNGASSHRFYGGMLYFGDPGVTNRRGINEWLKGVIGLSALDRHAYDVFAVAGQSNAMGVGDYTLSTPVPSGSAVEFINAGFLKPLHDPTQHNITNGANVSMSGSAWPAYGVKYFEVSGRRACIVGGAYSGVGLLHDGSGPTGGWQPAGPLVNDLAVKTNAAMAHFSRINSASQIKGVIWVGGEQDVLASWTVASYKAALVSLRDRFRAAMGNTRLLLLIVSLDKSLDAGNEVKYALIRQAQAEAAAENEGIHLAVPFQNYYDRGLSDGVHMNQHGLNDIGRIAANGATAAQGFRNGFMSLGTKPSITASSGVALAVQPTVNVLTAKGMVDATFTGSVTVSLVGTGALSGTLKKSAAAGVATFTDLVITGAGSSYLKFTGISRGEVQSQPVTTT